MKTFFIFLTSLILPYSELYFHEVVPYSLVSDTSLIVTTCFEKVVTIFYTVSESVIIFNTIQTQTQIKYLIFFICLHP